MKFKRILTPLLIILLLLSIIVYGAPTYVNVGPTTSFEGDIGVPTGKGYYINEVLFSTGGLVDIGALAKTDSNFIVGDGTNWVAETGAIARASLGLTIGTNVQAYDAGLLSLAGLTYVSDSFIKVTATDVYAIRTIAETKTDLALNLVDNTSDANKPVSTAGQAALDLKANLASPTFTGTVTAPTVLVSGLTASEIVGTDASKNLVSLAVATYPSLTELTYVKGVTSAIQTQLDAKQSLLPVVDTTGIAKGSVDDTKQIRLEVDGLTTATTRILTVPDKDLTLVGTVDKLSAFGATTSAELAGVISDETGSGKLVFATAPAFISRVSTGTTNPVSIRGFSSYQHSGNISAALNSFYKSRGTAGTPLTVAAGDYSGAFVVNNYDGTSWLANATFGYKVNGAASTGNVPGEWFWSASPANDSDPYTNQTVKMIIKSTGKIGLGGILSPTALVHIKAGTATANTAPLKFTSGTLLTTPEAGAGEFLTDKFYVTTTTGAVRKTLAYVERPVVTIAADDITPDVSAGEIFLTAANTGATEITDLDNPSIGKTITIIVNSATNPPTIADGGNFALSAAWAPDLNDVITLFVRADNDYVEISRSAN